MCLDLLCQQRCEFLNCMQQLLGSPYQLTHSSPTFVNWVKAVKCVRYCSSQNCKTSLCHVRQSKHRFFWRKALVVVRQWNDKELFNTFDNIYRTISYWRVRPQRKICHYFFAPSFDEHAYVVTQAGGSLRCQLISENPSVTPGILPVEESKLASWGFLLRLRTNTKWRTLMFSMSIGPHQMHSASIGLQRRQRKTKTYRQYRSYQLLELLKLNTIGSLWNRGIFPQYVKTNKTYVADVTMWPFATSTQSAKFMCSLKQLQCLWRIRRRQKEKGHHSDFQDREQFQSSLRRWGGSAPTRSFGSDILQQELFEQQMAPTMTSGDGRAHRDAIVITSS